MPWPRVRVVASARRVAWNDAVIAAPSLERDPVPIEAERPPYREPYVFSFRDPKRSFVFRFFAHLLVRLLIVTPLPARFQVAAALLPVSMLWPLVERQAKEPSEPQAEPKEPSRAEKRETGPQNVPVVLNGNGSPLRIEEPLARVTVTEWAADDIFKTKETDPLGDRKSVV